MGWKFAFGLEISEGSPRFLISPGGSAQSSVFFAFCNCDFSYLGTISPTPMPQLPLIDACKRCFSL